MLEEKTLFFTDYKTFDDPSEGCFPYENVIKQSHAIGQVRGDIPLEKRIEMAENHYRDLEEIIHKAGDYFINCWHMNEVESMAMWKLYSDINKGIAIQSTYENLDKCLSKYEHANDIAIGIVKYTASIDWTHECTLFRPFAHKRKSFEHECELRAILFRRHNIDNMLSDTHKSNDIPEDGIQIPVDLNILIDNIYISPKAPNWFEKLVITLLEKYNLGHKKELFIPHYTTKIYIEIWYSQ